MISTRKIENNPVFRELQAWSDELADWRRDLHRHPETAFEEIRTAEFVANRLENFGLTVRRGLAGTGVVGTLQPDDGSGVKIGLRADMDALNLEELNTFDHRSNIPGKMHGCGHDGHVVMLLAAAKYLAKHPPLKGGVEFIFQPAEEGAGGGRVMVEEGLFRDHTVDAVFGMHNYPGRPLGSFAVRPGPMMAGSATLEIKITGIGGHAAFPERAKNPVVVAAELISALQSVVPQGAAPSKSAVLTITQMHGGDAVAIIPETVNLKGTLRYFEPSIKTDVERKIEKIAAGLAKAHSVEIDVNMVPGYPPTINSAQETAISQQVLTQLTDKDRLDFDPAPAMGSEDFAYMLMEKPGCYVWLGNGGEEGGCFLHNPRYDFNDDATAFGATYWVHLVSAYLETTLSQ